MSTPPPLDSGLTRRKFIALAAAAGVATTLRAADAPVTIAIDPAKKLGKVSPLIYGQFIEHLGRCITGGIMEEGSPLSGGDGIRQDVLAKVKALAPPLLRYPGGTVSKIYHWEDGVGPKKDRRRRPNLIWTGIEDNHFGTQEFIAYCRSIGSEPFLVVNMATGTAEEASNWVEYCNGKGDTYYANLRRSHGSPEPFNVGYWGIGNEEGAVSDVGRLQDPKEYVRVAWQFIKLMKLQDPTIRLVLDGEEGEWNDVVLKSLSPVCDYLSLHCYVTAVEKGYRKPFEEIAGLEKRIEDLGAFVRTFPDVAKLGFWYRFPPREGPIRIAVDEWGLSGIDLDPKKPSFGHEIVYCWGDALGAACFLNVFIRQAKLVGLATYAQMVNVLAPILTSPTASVCQTVFYPLAAYTRRCRGTSVAVKCASPAFDRTGDGTPLPSLDVVALEREDGSIIVAAINRNPDRAITARLDFAGGGQVFKKAEILTADSVQSKNDLSNPTVNCVSETGVGFKAGDEVFRLPAHSISFLEFDRA